VGSLSPTFVPVRLVSLTVKRPVAFALSGWFPFTLRAPLGASVTLLEATAPVKLPTWRCPDTSSWHPLGPRPSQGGISTLAPPRPQPQLLRLPPILRNHSPNPTPSCSKAPRGLFVLLRVSRVFTASSTSPSPWLRQRPTRYAFRAGRNLPDKEFRYLRTVIVTAAVHRGFGSTLFKHLPLTFRHWAGVSPYTSAFAFAETCVFGKQSVGPFSCHLALHQVMLLPKLRMYVAEFLNQGSLVASVFSTSPPVSVCGTGGVASSLV
jgi:hypothetical protein